MPCGTTTSAPWRVINTRGMRPLAGNWPVRVAQVMTPNHGVVAPLIDTTGQPHREPHHAAYRAAKG